MQIVEKKDFTPFRLMLNKIHVMEVQKDFLKAQISRYESEKVCATLPPQTSKNLDEASFTTQTLKSYADLE